MIIGILLHSVKPKLIIKITNNNYYGSHTSNYQLSQKFNNNNIMTSMVHVSYESMHGSQHGNGEPRPVTYQTFCLAEV